jgi:phospholipid/cholesterol/gamma-HCH transport system substrate-binding protein
MDLHYKQEITVGALVLSAIALFVVGALWLGGKSIGNSGNQYVIEFTEVAGLKEGVPVVISGVNKGKVDLIRLVQPGKVLVTVSLDPNVQPRIDAQASIVPLNPLGDVAVSFSPGSSPEKLPEDVPVRGLVQPGLIERLGSLGDRADSVLLGAQQLVSQRTADDLHATMVAMQRMLNTLSERIPASTTEATRTMASFRELSARLDSTLANPGLSRGLASLDSVTQNLNTMTAQFTRTGATLDTLLAAMNRGEGTLGKFTSDSGLYVDMRGTLQSLKALIDQIQKDPGRITVQLKVF